MSELTKLEALLESLLACARRIGVDQQVELSALNEIKEVITAIISIALNDIKKKKHVRMCSALLFDDKKVSWKVVSL